MWISDLYEPVNDPDDHYDLAVAYGSAETRPGLIVLDDHLGRQDGTAPAVDDLAQLLGCPKPKVVMDSDTSSQLAWLRSQPNGSVDVISLGALTALDDLLANDGASVDKIRRVVVVAGDAAVGAEVEYNVAQDPAAFVRVMRSGLPIWWVPAFDGGLWQAGTSSFTVTSDAELLDGAPEAVKAWFDRYIGARYGPRNLWAAGLLAGLDSPAGAEWEQRAVAWETSGAVAANGVRSSVRQLVVKDRDAFEAAVIKSTRRSLSSLAGPPCPE